MIEDYKDSPLGKIPIDWKVNKFKEVTKTLTDYVASGSFASLKENVNVFDEPNYAVYVRQVDLNSKFKKSLKYVDKVSYDFLKNSNLFPSDIIFTNIGDLGRISIMPDIGQKATIAPNILLIRADENQLNQKFYYYLLSSYEGQKEIQKIKSGTGLPKINKGDLKEIWLKIPSLQEQQKIAEILSTVDDKIEIIDQQITETQALKKGLMQRLLTKGIGHTEFKDSPLGKIPKSWEYGPISKLISEKNAIKTGPFGSSITKSMYVESGYKIYGQEQVIANNPNIGNYFINEKKFNELKRYEIKTGDLLISLVGTLGKILVIDKNALPGIINPRLLKITPNQKEYSSKFLKQLLTSHNIQNQMTKMAVGGTMSIINGTIVKSIKTIKPPLEEQLKISKILSSVDEKLEVLSEKKTHYQELKQGLMQQLLTGKIRVKF